MAGQTKEHDIELGILTNTERSDDMPVDGKDNGKDSGKDNGKDNGKDKGKDNRKSTARSDDDHNYNSLTYRFWVQVGITSAVSVFCITMMATNSDKEGIYLPVLTGIMGYWLPSPDSRVKRPRD